MKHRLQDLWTWEGTIGRGVYAIVGTLALVVKSNLDRHLVTFFLGWEWDRVSYWIAPFGFVHSMTNEYGL